MWELIKQLDEMERIEFEEASARLIPWILTTIKQNHELNRLANTLLQIKTPEKYVSLMEKIFISSEELYLQLVHFGSPEIARRRQAIVG